jgi:hypothetical protein
MYMNLLSASKGYQEYIIESFFLALASFYVREQMDMVKSLTVTFLGWLADGIKKSLKL